MKCSDVFTRGASILLLSTGISIGQINNSAGQPASEATTAAPEGAKCYEMEGGKYTFTMDTAKAPELTEWANQTMAPVVQEWYPKLVTMLPSEGYEAPTNFSIVFSTNFTGVAATGGRRITGNANWYNQNLKGEAVGSIVHELVHVVQQYGRARRSNPNAARSPGWLVEGIPDYLRWYKFEPQSHGADIRSRNPDRVRYDGSYRVSANFLNWVTEKYDKEIVTRLNVAMREGKYSEDLWKERTGHTVQELGAEWKMGVLAKIDDARANTLTGAEKAAGWQLLFDGKDLDGWHNFKAERVRAGWQVKEGALVCVDPKNAGDIVTSNQFDWFELTLDYNITEAGNSGIMFHVTEEGRQAWYTGPEFQLEDNEKAKDTQRCGWLYALYKPEIDPKTEKPFDATKPVGQWNHVRLLVSPEKCEHDINGVKYFEYVLHSPDFESRVAKSKFRRMPKFAKSDLGFIALQGDHGSVSFRNIKIRAIESKK